MNTYDQSLKIMQREIADILCLELDEVTAESNFFTDLGGESIDFLELSFRLDKLSGVKIEIQQLARPDEVETDATGKLTDAAIRQIKKSQPDLDFTAFDNDPTRDGLIHLITVANLARVFRNKLQSAEVEDQQRATI